MQETATAIVEREVGRKAGVFASTLPQSLLPGAEEAAWGMAFDQQRPTPQQSDDMGMPPAVDEFSEDFAGYRIASSVNFYVGYYQISLAKESRNLTAFMTLVGLVRMTCLAMG
jgi:hypothetical protein